MGTDIIRPTSIIICSTTLNQEREVHTGKVVSVSMSYLSKPHAVPLVGRLLRLGRVHQLEARLILLVEVGVLTAASELRGVLV